MDVTDLNKFFTELAATGLKPFLSDYETTAYHGTLIQAANKIVSDQNFIMSVDGLLGPGAYFYEHMRPLHGAEAGWTWVMHRRRDKAITIDPQNIRAIAADIKLTRLFDMEDPRNERYLQAIYNFLVRTTGKINPARVGEIGQHTIGGCIARHASEGDQIQGIRTRLRLPKRGIEQISLVVRDQNCMFNLRHSEPTNFS